MWLKWKSIYDAKNKWKREWKKDPAINKGNESKTNKLLFNQEKEADKERSRYENEIVTETKEKSI